jgi:hypothetical protein
MSERAARRTRGRRSQRSRADTSGRVRPRPRSGTGEALRKKILSFTYGGRFRDDVQRAMVRYYGEETMRGRPLVLDEEEIPGFQEWYIHDFVTGEGARIIDLFAAEMGSSLKPKQRQILEDWRLWNRYRLWEVQSVMPGEGVVVRDLLSGEGLEINDISSSYDTIRWTLLLARPLMTEGRLSFTGSALLLTPMEKEGMVTYAQSLWADYQSSHPQADLMDFYRDHSLDLYRHAKELQEERHAGPYLTEEGHAFAPAEAHGDVSDAFEVERRLDEAAEFVYTGPAEEDPETLSYTWLLAGRSNVPASVDQPKKGVILRSTWTLGPGEPIHVSLGQAWLRSDRLELSCSSPERLAAGKALLSEVLGELIAWRSDSVHRLEEMLELGRGEVAQVGERKADVPLEVAMQLQRQMMDEHGRQWLGTPIPALGGMTPREAVRTAEGRAAVAELLKSMEYVETLRGRVAGQIAYDWRWILDELGLDSF